MNSELPRPRFNESEDRQNYPRILGEPRMKGNRQHHVPTSLKNKILLLHTNTLESIDNSEVLCPVDSSHIMGPISARWQKIGDAERLQRSSQVVSVIDGQAYVFGGELKPREPRDNDIQSFAVAPHAGEISVSTLPCKATSPSPRVGTAAATLNGKIYMFSGRGGPAMGPIDEEGAVWEYSPPTSEWSLLTPSAHSTQATPKARSFHCLTSDGLDTLYLHAGCPEKGRLSDLWSFNVPDKSWTQLASAPEPERGGASIAFEGGLLYRMNGFDGKVERGGALDIFDPKTNSWTTHSWPADGKSGPEARSVATLLPFHNQGRSLLLTLFGEHDPSSLGHEGAGKMLNDIWAYDIQNQKWHNIEPQPDQRLVGSASCPDARGWFAADTMGSSALVQGGLGETNTRLADAWLLSFD